MRRIWQQQQFAPSWWGVAINPFFHARRGLMRELRPVLQQLEGRVLDVGCGRKPYREWTRATEYVGLDVETDVTRALACADVFYDGRAFPFADASFDGVLCSQVLEHVFTPEAFLTEIFRVLRPGGRLVLTVPFVWDEHEQPHDFGRYTSFGLRALLERGGFTIIAQRKSVADLRTLGQLASGWIHARMHTRVRVVNLVVQFLLIAPINLAAGLLGAIFPANPAFYLDNVVLARRPVGGA